MNPRRYEIRLYDQTLVEFSISDGLFGPEVTLDDHDPAARELMPCGLALDPDAIWRWLETRSIPTNRRNAARICQELGFTLGDLEALYRASLGLSLNDSYWVVPRGFGGRFDDYNLYENPFSEAIGALAVAGEVREQPLSGNTPELTTDGTLRKGWRIRDGRRVLYKGASEGFAPGEPLSEYIASLIGRDLGLDCVRYGLDVWQGEACSTCEDFATKDVSYVPFSVATGTTSLVGVLAWCAAYDRTHASVSGGKMASQHEQAADNASTEESSKTCSDEANGIFEQLCDMLAFDALVCNTDRHLTNFGILRDNHTGRAVGLAPIFDNGRALFPNVADDDSEQFVLEAQLHGPAFGGASFEELLSRVMGARQQKLLARAEERGIIGNTLAPSRRVAALDAYLRKRAEQLQEIKPANHKQLLDALSSTAKTPKANQDGVIRV